MALIAACLVVGEGRAQSVPQAATEQAATEQAATAPSAASGSAESASTRPASADELPFDLDGPLGEAVGRAATTGCACAAAGVAGCLATGGLLLAWSIPVIATAAIGSSWALVGAILGIYVVLPLGYSGALAAMPIGVVVGGLLYDQRPASLLAAAAATVVGIGAGGLLLLLAGISGSLTGGLAMIPLVIAGPVLVVVGTYLTYNAVAFPIGFFLEPARPRCDRPRELCDEPR